MRTHGGHFLFIHTRAHPRLAELTEMAPTPRLDSDALPATAERLAHLRQLVERQLPHVSSLCEWEHATGWVGSRPLTPDSYPIVGRVLPGLYLNAGHSFNGWRDAALTARVLGARMVGGAEERALPAYAAAFEPKRFRL